MKAIAAVGILFATLIVLSPAAQGDDCGVTATIYGVAEHCNLNGSPGAAGSTTTTHSTAPVDVITHEPVCLSGNGNCAPTPCATAAGESGYEYGRYVNGVFAGEECLTPAEVVDPEPRPPSPAEVLAAARRLSWPEAKLVIQPPDGETLVNFATNFYSTSTQPVTRTARLVRTSVTVEATPQSYTWRFGDGNVRTTSDPGAAYPDLRITHSYLRKGQVAPRLDVTYGGRYQLGDGTWHDLPGTLTVTGTPQALTILTATPHLTG